MNLQSYHLKDMFRDPGQTTQNDLHARQEDSARRIALVKTQREAADKDQEQLYYLKQAVEMMQLGVIITDLDGNIVYTNPAAAEMHGFEVEDLLGQPESLLVPPEFQKPSGANDLKYWNGLIRECGHQRKDGTRFPVWLMSEIVQNVAGEPWAIVTSCEDITERKQAEEALRAYQDHLEDLVEVRTIQLMETNQQLQQEIEERKRAEQALSAYRDHLEEMVAQRTTELTRVNEQLRREITQHTLTSAALQKSKQRYQIVLDSAPEPVIVYDPQGKVTYLNAAFTRVFGWTLAESQGQKINFIPTETFFESCMICTKIRRGETVSGIETIRLTREGKPVHVSISGAGFFDQDRQFQGSIITVQDITERKQAEEHIRFFAYHDTLTGLPNRTSFYMGLQNELKRSQSREKDERRQPGAKWVILFLDLDRFKYVNDSLGHDVGDLLLKDVAARLRRCLRQSDYIFRLGGDEFTILLTDLSTAADAAKVAEKIMTEMAQPYTIQENELYITVSIGISVYPDDGETIETLVKNADMAMYAAKDTKQGYRFFTEELHQKTLERMRMDHHLRTALEENQFKLCYQPLVDRNNRLVGLEALLRWHHPELGVLSPSQFIPLAEETGVIIPIGDWVLQEACQQMHLWRTRWSSDLYVTVNLSPRQFNDPHLGEKIDRILETTGLDPQTLNLEVTESGIMEHPDEAVAQMIAIRARGVHFSIDDFGTGYSSLSHLKRFPINTLKIDRSFVKDCSTDRDDQEIIKTIIAMARNLNLQTVAEGIETRAQYDFMVEQGSDLLQGYYVGRPLSAEQFEERLQETGS